MWILSGSRQRHPTTTSTLWWHCRCWSATAYSSDNKRPLSSQLTSISEGRSPIRHLGRRLVAGSSAPTLQVVYKNCNCRRISGPSLLEATCHQQLNGAIQVCVQLRKLSTRYKCRPAIMPCISGCRLSQMLLQKYSKMQHIFTYNRLCCALRTPWLTFTESSPQADVKL